MTEQTSRISLKIPIIPLPDQPIQYPPAQEPDVEEEAVPEEAEPIAVPAGPDDLPGVPSEPVIPTSPV